jgi:transposase-like protein
MSRAATQVTLHADERQVLQKRAQARRVERRHQQRARVVLLAAQGWSNEQIAPHVGLNVNSVRKWRDRYARAGLAALEDEPRTGRPSRLDPQKVALSEVVQPPAPRTRWSVRSMACHAGVSKSTVQKLWAQNDLKPHLTRTFKLSADPAFEAKFWDVIGLYLSPPDQALVLCCDEKSQIQALQRTQPGLALNAGRLQTHTHDYYRHGTVTLFAALDYLQGKIIARTERRHTQPPVAAVPKANRGPDARQGPPAPHRRQLRHPQTRQGQSLAGASPALPPAFYPHRFFLAQPGGTLFPRLEPAGAGGGQLRQRAGVARLPLALPGRP